MTFLRYLITFIFVVFGFGELLRIQLPNSVGIGLIDVIIVAVVLVWLFVVKKGEYFLKTPILFFVAAALISLIFNLGNYPSDKVIVGALYLARWVLYAGLYFVFVDVGKKLNKKKPFFMILSGIIVLTIGFIQFFFYPSLKNLSYLGWDEHLYRLFSSFLDPNFTGTFLVLFLIFVYIIRDKFKMNKKTIYLLNSLLLFNFIGIILTYSRSALLTLLTSALVYCFIQKKYNAFVTLIITLVVIVILLSPRFYLVNTNLFRTPSLEARVANIKEALTIYKEKPIFGVGFNNFRFAREKYGYKDRVPFGFSHSGGGADSSFALVIATSGILGFLAYIFLLFKMLKLGLKNTKKNKYALILVVSLSGLFVNSLLLNSLFYSFIMIWMWILAGLTESSSRE